MITSELSVERGIAVPLGASLVRGGVNFAVYSRRATAVTLVLFAPAGAEPLLEVPLDPRIHRTGDVWHVSVGGLNSGFEYGFRVDGPAAPRNHFDPRLVLIDPYARALAGGERWRDPETQHRRGIAVSADFDWGLDQPLNRPLADTVIYEMHVRGFTQDPASGVAWPGTFAGIFEKIPYLVDLGVTAVELMPITEFDELNTPGVVNPLTGERLVNYWGYHPIAFFAPKASYASEAKAGCAVQEFKQLVRALHAAGIEVILDLVFNHTGEGRRIDPTVSLRGIDNATYYIADPVTGEYRDYTGCGNTLNCNHPVVRDLVLDCLRYWVTEMHVDGFRFDLASVLARGPEGEVLAEPPLLERISGDPVLAQTKLIAEAWDAAGLYQVGSFPSWGRWAEWNGRFRDDVRRFVKGDAGMVGALASRLAGSPDLYRADGRSAHHSINFITSHDGFTLADLVSYNVKHNEANGEQSRDGNDQNDSWNCGWEGDRRAPGGRALAETATAQSPDAPVRIAGRADAAGGGRMWPHAARQQQRVLSGRPGLVDAVVGRCARPRAAALRHRAAGISARASAADGARLSRCEARRHAGRGLAWPGTASAGLDVSVATRGDASLRRGSRWRSARRRKLALGAGGSGTAQAVQRWGMAPHRGYEPEESGRHRRCRRRAFCGRPRLSPSCQDCDCSRS